MEELRGQRQIELEQCTSSRIGNDETGGSRQIWRSKPQNFQKTFVTNNLSNDDWRKPIIEFLKNLMGMTDRKIKYKALSYIIIDNKFFKNTHGGVLLKCLPSNI